MSVSRMRQAVRQVVLIGVKVLFLGDVLLAAGASTMPSDAARMSTSSKPWKYDVKILPSTSQYRVGLPQFRDALHCDEKGHIWLRLHMKFSSGSDYYHPCFAEYVLVSKDQGLTWEFTYEPWPWPRDTRSVLPDGTIIETGCHCFVDGDRWERYPLSEKERLQKKGYYIGHKKNRDYLAIIYDLWMRRSTDGGKTWVVKPIYKQFPFFAYLVSRHYQRVLADGTIVAFCSIRPTPEGPRSACIVRSEDKGDTWEIVTIADGRLSHVPEGFHETFPIVYPDGRIFVMMRSKLAESAYLVRSDDGGKTWTKPKRTVICAKHPVPTLLRDGTIVVTYSRRFARPYGIRARFTSDLGETWSDEVVIRDEFEISNGLAHPLTVELPDGTLFTALQADKYLEGDTIQHGVYGSRWTRNYRRPSAPELPVPPRRPKYNADRAERSPWDHAKPTK